LSVTNQDQTLQIAYIAIRYAAVIPGRLLRRYRTNAPLVGQAESRPCRNLSVNAPRGGAISFVPIGGGRAWESSHPVSRKSKPRPVCPEQVSCRRRLTRPPHHAIISPVIDGDADVGSAMKRGPADTPGLTKELIAQSRVIARGRRIRDLERLIRKYGGKPSMWTKKSSPAVQIQGDSYEYHWYEHPGIGRFEIKRKKVRDL